MAKRLLTCAFTLAFFFVTAQEIFDMPGADATYLAGINDSGEICGYYTIGGNSYAFEINKYGDTLYFNYPGSNLWNTATGINNQGVICGNYTLTTPGSANQAYVFHPLQPRTSSGTYVNVSSTFGGTYIDVEDITDNICVAGNHHNGNNGEGLSWCNSSPNTSNSYRCNNQGTVYPTYVQAMDINGHLGGYMIEGAGEQGFVYYGSGLGWDTFSISGSLKTRVYGMNDNHVLCGNYFSETKAFVATKQPFQALTDLHQIYILGAASIYPQDINNNNDVVGYFTDTAGKTHGFILGTYDIGFRPSVNGYGISNDTAFPQKYWQNFDYSYDPFLGAPDSFPRYPNGDVLSSALFPPWRDFVRAMGFSECYDAQVVLKQYAYNIWASGAGAYGGTCFGFGNTSAEIFDSLRWYDDRFIGVQFFSGLITNDYPFQDTVLSALYQTQSMWDTRENKDWADIHCHDFVPITAQYIKQNLRNSRGRPHATLTLVLQHDAGAHCLLPYRLVPSQEGMGIDTVYVYDCNFPNNDGLYILLDAGEQLNGNFYYTANGLLHRQWGNSPNGHGLYLNSRDSIFTSSLHPAALYNPYNQVIRSSPLIEARFNDSSLVSMKDDNSNTAIFSIDSDIATSLITPFHTPKGRAYDQALCAFSHSTITQVTKTSLLKNNFLAINGDNYFIRCDRTKGTGAIDNYQFSVSELTYLDKDTGNRQVAYTVIQVDSGKEYTYFITAFNVAAGNKVTASTVGTNGMALQNFGPPTSYIITTEFITPDSLQTFRDTIAMQGNTTHTILPHDTTYSGIYILVDTGMTGHIVDSIFIHQTPNDINKVNAPNITAWPIPGSTELFMKGPMGKVTYKITDALGRMITTGESDFGNGSTEKFDISHFAPGVYNMTGSGNAGKWTFMFVKQ